MLRQRLADAYSKLVCHLQAEQQPPGFWLGELSPSALANATAISALCVYLRSQPNLAETILPIVRQGLKWLIETQNADGGWGDTPRSSSNIATTLLVCSALQLSREALPGALEPTKQEAVQAADQNGRAYLDKQCGAGPSAYAMAIRQRYGRDHTFSVPILMNAALAGLIPWHLVPHLPFELAVLPQRTFRFLRLPVVSYALPALIAIGQAVSHYRGPAWWQQLRRWAVLPTLFRLRQLQPESGGFLEAVPLTAFVILALASTGQHNHPVCRDGIRFLIASARPDGSWPIDSNLSVWLTTLSVLALGADQVPNRPATLQWILQHQVRRRHPYTGAEPGGWGWSHLSGSVPDVDDTSGALLALAELLNEENLPDHADAVFAGLRWLLDLQNRDGGWPTFCRGWGYLPFDRSAADLTAHALRAFAAWWPMLRRWRHSWDDRYRVPAAALVRRIVHAVRDGFQFLRHHQREDGAWLPLWFGNEAAPDEANLTYGTARVVHAWLAWGHADEPAVRRAVQWLLLTQNNDGGWGGQHGLSSTVEETALALDALLAWLRQVPKQHGEWVVSSLVERGLNWLLDALENHNLAPSPIGLYFARLWYYEKLYPIIFATQALRRAFHLFFHTS
ncbi:MAG: prenyltransferase/squalene oxidase repeat-containing protein [Gemmatales bacterium]|nr:squalene--hopene cyclase [Gemmatales bacterium]MDW7994955.1 prenyltransferase/squalene oxidase repeat-containing protein [Gemmatales bacterium]